MFYKLWSGSATMLMYDEAKQAVQVFANVESIRVDLPILACAVMGEMATADGQDRKLMEPYYSVYQRRALPDVRAELNAYNALESYLNDARERTGQHPLTTTCMPYCGLALKHAPASMRQREKKHRPLKRLAFYSGMVLVPPLIVVCGGVVWVSIKER